MFYLTRPTSDQIQKLIEEQREQPFTYLAVGATQTLAPAGFTVDHNRIQIGAGYEAFQRAKLAIQRWEMFRLGWVELCWPHTPIEEAQVVAVLVHHLGFWSVNPARIVYTVDNSTDEFERYGFAYGTLPAHGECGEERFTVEWSKHDGSVWYDLFAFSKPNHFLAQIGYPFTRKFQKRFAQDSKRAMADFVQP